MVVIWYVLALAPFIVIPLLWLGYRRKQAERERAANARWQQMLGNATATERAAEGLAAAEVVPVAQRAQPAPLSYQRQPRLLDAPQTLLFYLLRSGLPEYEIFAQVGVDRLLVPAGTERERQLRMMAQHPVDFVVCDKSMQPIAAVDLMAAEAPAALTSALDIKTQWFAASGMRYVRIARTAMPKREEVRAVVLGPQAIKAPQ